MVSAEDGVAAASVGKVEGDLVSGSSSLPALREVALESSASRLARLVVDGPDASPCCIISTLASKLTTILAILRQSQLLRQVVTRHVYCVTM